MKALILVDIQNDFLPGGALAVPNGDEVIEVANRLMPLFPRVVATKDWHPENHGSFAVNHPGGKPYALGELNGLPQVLWPVHCVENSRGAAFATALHTLDIHIVFLKGTDPEIDSYSGFFDNGRRKSTGLEHWLREEGVDEVFVMGLATDYCVRATAMDAISLGFRTSLVLDGCRGVDVQPGDSIKAVEEMKNAGVQVVLSSDLVMA